MGESKVRSAWIGLIILCMATLSANAAIRITGIRPQTNYVGVHKTYRFRVNASGTKLAFQWWHQEPDSAVGHPIPVEEGFGSNRRLLVVTDAQLTRDYNGWYWCVVTSKVTSESVRSPDGEVFVIGPPVVIEHPQSQTVPVGSPVTFAVQSDPLGPVAQKYQWFFNERPLSGKTRSTLEIPVATSRKAGLYACRVRTIGGDTMSDGANLTVGP